jgi:hypothetical protein
MGVELYYQGVVPLKDEITSEDISNILVQTGVAPADVEWHGDPEQGYLSYEHNGMVLVLQTYQPSTLDYDINGYFSGGAQEQFDALLDALAKHSSKGWVGSAGSPTDFRDQAYGVDQDQADLALINHLFDKVNTDIARLWTLVRVSYEHRLANGMNHDPD